jgi:hypothetical protein
MKFEKLRNLIHEESKNGETSFCDSGSTIEEAIFTLPKSALTSLLYDIGTIPEDIGHDTTEEKLYAEH